MTRWDESVFDPYLPADLIVRQAEIGVIAADRQGNVLFVNEHAARLLRLPADAAKLAGQPLVTIGFIPESDLPKADDMARQVLRGLTWEGTFADSTAAAGDGGLAFVRTLAVPLRSKSGDIDGMVLLLSNTSRRDAQREQDRLRLLERIGERLSGSLELGATLRQVAQILVPHFADHCFIDLFHGDKLIRRVQTNAGGWVPPAGTWAEVGEQVHYPPGHFCEQAMSRLETIVVPDLQAQFYPAPSQQSMHASNQAGLTSVLAAPLYARGELLGVMCLALSAAHRAARTRTTSSPDRDLIGAIASRVAVAIDNAMLFEAERLDRPGVPEQPAAAARARARRPGGSLPLRAGQAAGDRRARESRPRWAATGTTSSRWPPAGSGIVIGDVEGRGARAAAIMGQLRAALRAFAQDEKSPADIMRKLDEWCRSLAPADDAEPAGRRPAHRQLHLHDLRRLVPGADRSPTPGHDAPLLITGGQVRQLEFQHKGVLLGVRGKGIRGLPTYKEQTRDAAARGGPGLLHRRPDRPAVPGRTAPATTPRPRPP